MHTDRRNLPVVDPYARVFRHATGAQPDGSQCNDQRLFHLSEVPVEVLRVLLQVDDRIADQLAGTVKGCVATPLDLEALLVTRSEEGMTLFTQAGATHEPTRAREVFDVSGAGDTVIGTLGLMLAAGLSMADAMHIANLAAGIVVGKLGTATASREEILAALAQ